MSIWQFPDLRVQPGSHCRRPKWHYKSLKIFSEVSVSRKILCRNVGKLQNTIPLDLQCVIASPTNSPRNYWGYIKFSGLSYLINPYWGGGGQMALPLNLNVKNLLNANFFLIFLIHVYFLWASVSELQPKTFAKNSAVLKEEEN